MNQTMNIYDIAPNPPLQSASATVIPDSSIAQHPFGHHVGIGDRVLVVPNTPKPRPRRPANGCRQIEPVFVTVKFIATAIDAHRSTARRWLTEAGIQPVAFGSGPKGGIRYKWSEVNQWLESRKQVH